MDAMLTSILQSQVLAMDETPIKAGKAGPGKMKQSYFWPVYGELTAAWRDISNKAKNLVS
ncbi:hypothetical protein B4P00_21190 [Shewanella xiamenensis]|nr:hypothetical protein [Shewanella xiamenensis]